jgi:hypothetical protein
MDSARFNALLSAGRTLNCFESASEASFYGLHIQNLQMFDQGVPAKAIEFVIAADIAMMKSTFSPDQAIIDCAQTLTHESLEHSFCKDTVSAKYYQLLITQTILNNTASLDSIVRSLMLLNSLPPQTINFPNPIAMNTPFSRDTNLPQLSSKPLTNQPGNFTIAPPLPEEARMQTQTLSPPSSRSLTSPANGAPRGNPALTPAAIAAVSHLYIREAAARLGVSPTTLKAACRRAGLARWPRAAAAAATRAAAAMADAAPRPWSAPAVDMAYVRRVCRRHAGGGAKARGRGSPGVFQ